MEGALAEVRQELNGLIDRKMPGPLRAAMLPVKGKLNRARLVLTCAALAGSVEARTLSLAVAVELLHWASLLQDDIIDRATLRRGSASIHLHFGTGAAILIADWLFSEAYQRFNQAGPGFVFQINRAVRKMALGELRQVLGKTVRPSKLGYLRYSYQKTAIFFEICARVGVDSVREEPCLSQTAGRIGFWRGLAYQLQNDLHDILTMETKADQDRHNGIYTLPLILLQAKTGLSFSCLEKMSQANLLQLATDTGVIESCLALEKKFVHRATCIFEREFLPEERRAKTAGKGFC